jgi:hypothetical protein
VESRTEERKQENDMNAKTGTITRITTAMRSGPDRVTWQWQTPMLVSATSRQNISGSESTRAAAQLALADATGRLAAKSAGQ